MGFFGKFFIAIFVVCAACGAWAQCCSCDSNDGCPIGQHNVGQNPHTWHIYCEDCVSVSGTSVDCSHCNCYGYNDQCPFGNPDGKKCKEVVGKCPSPCEYYKLCDVATGNITATQIVGACHIEGENCYANEVPCSVFATRSDSITCPKANQTGSAVWDDDHWRVDGCGCSIRHAAFETFDFLGLSLPIWCDDFYATYTVTSANSTVNTVQDEIVYTITSKYCAKCHPGWLPATVDSPDGGVFTRPLDISGNWGVVACSTQVTAPNYAYGCVIDFNLATDDMMAECRKQCPDGFETEINGATKVEDCLYDGYTTYTDDTGTFYIGSLDNCP